MPIHGLESVIEQSQALGGLSSKDQVALLNSAVCHNDVVQGVIDATLERYLRRDLGGLAQLSRNYRVDDEALHERVMNSLIVERNVRMVERMESMLRQGGTFIAVGALHLPDKNGVLALLEMRGFHIRVIY